ncbi:MAG TPA: metallophosphoesterase [Bryobacteraceae bacterium]|nr:metallophosphoesterase [Bryobacteraceae bacterium]
MARTPALALSLLVATSLCHAGSLIRLPYLQNVGTNCATILWTASERGSGAVEYSADGDLSRSVSAQVREFPPSASNAGFFQYQVDIRGLTPGRGYLYQVLMNGEVVAADLHFRTTPGGAFTFLALGDSGAGNDAQQAIARRMIDSENPAFVLHTGDLSQESGTLDQLNATYFGVYRDLMSRTPFFPTPGNHDYYTDSGAPYLSSQSPPPADAPPPDQGRYYSFNWGSAHFISLNSNLLEVPGPAADRMLAWLERDLQRQTRFWRVVYLHHPPYPTGHHTGDPVSTLVRERIVPILEKYNVQLVLSGHEHSYQRTHPVRNGVPVNGDAGTVYVITGGGGAALHSINPTAITAVAQSAHHYLRCDVRGANLTVTAIGAEGDVIDRFTLTRPAQVEVESVVNLGSYTREVATGSLISIFGRALAASERSTPALPYPEQLGGVKVTWNGTPAQLLSVSPYQINAHLPYGISGPGVLRVENQAGGDDLELEAAPAAPAIVTIPAGFRLAPAITDAMSGKLITRASPGLPGNYVTIYAVGLGEVVGGMAAGAVAVQIGNTTVAPSFAGVAPGYAGLYQLNVAIPAGTPAGPTGLRIRVGEAVSEPATLFVGRGPE